MCNNGCTKDNLNGQFITEGFIEWRKEDCERHGCTMYVQGGQGGWAQVCLEPCSVIPWSQFRAVQTVVTLLSAVLSRAELL